LHAPIDPESHHSIRKGNKSSHRSRGNEIVTARMANPGKRIVLCVEIDGPAAVSTDNLESRLQTVRMPLDLVAQVI
jgi:glycine cleavage system regulatory protein